MKTQIMIRGFRAAVPTVSLLCATMLFAHAEEAPVVNAITVRVGTLRNAGGAALKGPDGRALSDRFTDALKSTLNESSKGRFTAKDDTSKGDDFNIEGDLSQLEGNKGDNDGFLCVIRLLHAENGGSRLVGQWAGTARSLRDLTGNLEKDARVSKMGLAGELAMRVGRIVGYAAGEAKTADNDGGTTPAVYNKLIKTATDLRRLTIDVMPEGSSEQKARNTLLPGEKYRLRISPQDTGTIYILALDSNGKPSSPYAQNEALQAAPGRSVTLPPNSPFVAPKSGAVSWVVLLRRREGGEKTGLAAPSAAQFAPITSRFALGGTPVLNAPLALPGALAETSQNQGIRGGDPYAVPDEPYGVPDSLYTVPDPPGTKAPAVFVIGGGIVVAPAPLPVVKSKLDEETERILDMMKKDAPGTWVGLEIKLPVVAGGEKTGLAAPTASLGTRVQTPLGAIKTEP